MNLLRETSKLSKLIIIGAYLIGLFFVASGIIMVFSGASGNTEFSFFGQKFKSENVGITAIFLGAATIILLIRYSSKIYNSALKYEAKKYEEKSDESYESLNQNENNYQKVKNIRFFKNFLQPAYNKFEKAHQDYTKTFKRYRDIISNNDYITEKDIWKSVQLLFKDSIFSYHLRTDAIQEAELLKCSTSFNFNPFISAINRYFTGPIEGKSDLPQHANKLSNGHFNLPRAKLFNVLRILKDSLGDEKMKAMVTVDSLDEIMMHLQKQKELIHAHYLIAKKKLFDI